MLTVDNELRWNESARWTRRCGVWCWQFQTVL